MTSPTKLSVLVVDDEEELRDLTGFILESNFNASIQYASSGNDAIQLLKTPNLNFDFIVSDYNMTHGTGGDIFKYLHEMKLTIPFILCSTDEPKLHPEFMLRPLAGFAKKPFFEKPLITAVDEIAKTLTHPSTTPPEPVQVDPESFFRAHIRLFKLINIVPCEVFIRLSDTKYVKLYQERDIFSDAEFLKWQSKRVDFLYIRQKDFSLFTPKLFEEYESLSATRTEHPSSHTEWTINQDIQESVHDIGSRLGFTKELEQMTKGNITRTMKLLSKNPSLGELLNRAQMDSANYISSHSITLSYVTCWLATKMEWYSEQTSSKLILASLLHDITLTDHELAKVQNEKELFNKDSPFSKEGCEQWKQHSLKGASIAAQFTEVPPDVDVIIAQHHELPHGDGTPNHLTHTRIAPLAALFIISHDLINYLATPNSDVNKFALERKDRYDVGQFKRILDKVSEKPSP